MSIRVYTGPHSEGRNGPPVWISRIPVALTALTIVLQIAWPLSSGSARASLTVVTVWAFFLASMSHAALTRGWSWTARWAVVSIVFGFVIELLGTSTGIPFTTYTYDPDALGWSLSGIPVVIPLAWAMMSYPAILVGRRIVSSSRMVVLASAWALASWDLFLDPQMVGEGYWTWQSPEPALPGIPGIPLLNFVGWLLASLLLMLVLNRLLPDPDRTFSAGSGPLHRRRPPEGVPATLYLWTWVGGIVANVFFLDRPWVGIIGGIAMGIVAVPYAFRLTERAP